MENKILQLNNCIVCNFKKCLWTTVTLNVGKLINFQIDKLRKIDFENLSKKTLYVHLNNMTVEPAN